jgi:V8-like Glu-specific endopeptidase
MKNLTNFVFLIIFSLSLYLTACKKARTPVPSKEANLPQIADGTILTKDSNFISELYAIGQFKGNSTCTGVYIKTSDAPNAPVYILTNGHCVISSWDDNEIILNRDYPNYEIKFKVFDDIANSEVISILTKKIVYSTMKGRDIAIVELDATHSDLQSKGIFPIKIAEAAPAIDTEIRAYGIPTTFDKQVVRQSTCIQKQKENIAEFIWVWFDVYSNECKDIYPGSSGSPVISDFDKGVWGLINTTTIGATSACALGSPCKFKGTIELQPNTTYVMNITDLKQCFSEKGIFEEQLAANVLEMPHPHDAEIKIGPRNFSLEYIAKNKLEIVVSNTGNNKYLLSPIQDFDRENKDNYISFSEKELSIDFPTEEGLYILAIVYEEDFEHQDFLTFQIDGTRPNHENIKLSINKSDKGVSFEPIFNYPELVGYEYKFGAVSECNCEDLSNYLTYLRIPIFVSKSEYKFPIKVCIIGSDLADNKSLAKEFIID